MLGWHISVFRQVGDGASPATTDSPQGARLAIWQADLSGGGWLDDLVERGRAVALGGDGYPSLYTLQAHEMLAVLRAGPPHAKNAWIAGPHDVLTDEWVGRTAIDSAVAKDCRADEWLVVEVWDES